MLQKTKAKDPYVKWLQVKGYQKSTDNNNVIVREKITLGIELKGSSQSYSSADAF